MGIYGGVAVRDICVEYVVKVQRQFDRGLFDSLPPVDNLRYLILSFGPGFLRNTETPDL